MIRPPSGPCFATAQNGIKLSYIVQPRPEGLAQAYILGADFVGGDSSALILGDNLFFGHGLTEQLSRAPSRPRGATVFGYWPAGYFVPSGLRETGLERNLVMPKKRFSAEHIVILLRQIEVLISQGKYAPIACRDAGISQQKLRDELLNREIFYSLKEAKAVIGQWRSHYNAARPHSSLAYRPPAPQASSPVPPPLDQAAAMQ